MNIQVPGQVSPATPTPHHNTPRVLIVNKHRASHPSDCEYWIIKSHYPMFLCTPGNPPRHKVHCHLWLQSLVIPGHPSGNIKIIILLHLLLLLLLLSITFIKWGFTFPHIFTKCSSDYCRYDTSGITLHIYILQYCYRNDVLFWSNILFIVELHSVPQYPSLHPLLSPHWPSDTEH